VQRALVSLLFFLGLMVILRTLIEAIPRWKARKKKKNHDKKKAR